MAGTDAEGEGEGGSGARSGGGTDEAAAWGHRPPLVAGNGAGETLRKFAAARRKYLALYTEVLAKLGAQGDVGALDTLLAAHAFLVSPTQWTNPAILADVARRALGRTHCPAVLVNTARQELQLQPSDQLLWTAISGSSYHPVLNAQPLGRVLRLCNWTCIACQLLEPGRDGLWAASCADAHICICMAGWHSVGRWQRWDQPCSAPLGRSRATSSLTQQWH